MDHNVGRILSALETYGFSENTHVIYTSDHGDNVGHRGLWGKSNFYLESVAVPMIVAGPGIAPGVKHTPVSLLDLQPTILESLSVDDDRAALPADLRRPGQSLLTLANAPDDHSRTVFSEYHAAGSPSAGFMLRKGRWKYHHYVDFRPELFDLDADREETHDLATDPGHADVLAQMEAELRTICSPEAVNDAAKRDQNALIERYGGRDKAMFVGAPAATPVPGANVGFGE